MGRQIDPPEVTRGQRTHYRPELRRDLDQVQPLLDTAAIIHERTVGLERAVMLAEPEGSARALPADPLLEELGEEHYAHEIGRSNLEASVPVSHPAGSGLRALEITLAERVGQAEAAAQGRGARVIPIGHLPTITEDLFT